VALLHGPDSYAEATEQWVRCSFCDRLQVIERLRRAGLDVPPQSAGDKRE